MSKIRVWKNKGLILEGIKNRIFKKEHVEEIHNERMEVCKKCPHLDTEGSNCYMPGTQPCCSLCGCSLGLKLRALSAECDDKRWQAVLSEEEEDLLNENIDDGFNPGEHEQTR